MKQETDYLREAENQMRQKKLLEDEPAFYIPEVIPQLTTKRVLTTYMAYGDTIEKLRQRDQALRNWVCPPSIHFKVANGF